MQPATGNHNSVARLCRKTRGQPLSDQNISGTVVGPGAGHFPPGVSGTNAGGELFFAQGDLLGEVSTDQGEILLLTAPLQRNIHRQHRREPSDVVVPERTLDLREVRFIQESAIARRLQVDTANFNV